MRQGSVMENSNSINSTTVEIKSSKTDLPVPVVNSVHLHSIYNPEREAEGFVNASENTLAKGSKILIFGLGFGYHIAKTEQRLKTLYPNGFSIFVIEPNKELYKKWKELRPNIFSPNTKVVCYSEVKDFYKDKELVEFLSLKPGILPHPASFQLNDSFFKTFMSFHYPTSLKESLYFIEDESFQNYFEQEEPGLNSQELFEKTKNKSFLQGYDFLTLALNEMVTGK